MEWKGLDKQIKSNINSILLQYYNEGKSEVSVKKLIEYIKKSYNFEVDSEYISTLLSTNPVVDSIADDKIILGTPEQHQSEEENSELHDNAIDQAQKDLETFESVADALDKIEVGYKFPSNKVKLDENDLFYHLHKGAVKTKSNYIVANVLPKKDLNESTVNCKIEGTSFFVEIPVKNFVKKLDNPKKI